MSDFQILQQRWIDVSKFLPPFEVEPLGTEIFPLYAWKNNTKALQQSKVECLKLPDWLEPHIWNPDDIFAESRECRYLFGNSTTELYSTDRIGTLILGWSAQQPHTAYVRPHSSNRATQVLGTELYWFGSIGTGLCWSRLGSDHFKIQIGPASIGPIPVRSDSVRFWSGLIWNTWWYPQN